MADNYIGFSSAGYSINKQMVLNNVTLIKQDLLNNIFTRRGERIKMPTFGTRIPDLIFEPLDEVSTYVVQQDLTDVINFDPRVELADLEVIPLYDQNTIMAFATLNYIYLGFTDRFDVNIQFQSN